MSRYLRTAAGRYGMALGLTMASLLARLLLWPLIGSSSPYLTSYLAVAAAALWCGFGPAVMVTVLSAIIGNLVFLRPLGQLNYAPAELARLAWMLASNLAIAVIAARVRRSQIYAQRQAEASLLAQHALRGSEQRLRVIFDHAGVGIVEVVGDDRFVAVNEQACRILGRSREQLLTMDVHALTWPDDRELSGRMNAEVHSGQRDRADYEKRYIRGDGSPVWVHVTVSAVRDADGHWERSVTTIEDITERRRAHGAKAMLAAVVDSSADAIVSESLDGTILSWNAAAEQLYGYSAKEAVGRPVEMLFPEGHIPLMPEHLDRLERGETIHRQDVERRRKDGSRVFVSLSVSPVRDEAGRMIGLAKIAHDVTALREAHEALEAAKAVAEDANKAKDQFLAILSHELRTPLTPIVAAVNMLQEGGYDQQMTRESLEMIHRNVEMEARLIDDLLDVTRIVRGKIELDRRPTPLREIIGQALEVCRQDIEARELHLAEDLNACADHLVDADPARLQQVFWNLLKNAAKFTPHGGCIGIRSRCDGDHIVTEVIDSGEGIEAKLLPRIFNAFEQGGARVTRQFGGLGLGLTITRGIVEMHGGTIEAHSEGKGRGATFRVRLPIVTAQAVVSADRQQPAGSALPEAGNKGPRLRILLVEDHGDTAKVMRRLLSSRGYEVETAGDVATALELIEREPFDLLLSDLGLPDGSGVDLMRKLREQGRRIPGIALSGFGQEQDVRRSKEAGFATHLTKPANPDLLTRTIGAVIHAGEGKAGS